MELLADWTLLHGDETRKIRLLHGDLAALTPEYRADLLVISAFPNDYSPSETSLIGALHRSGISVELLAHDKQIDLRKQYSCWLSKPLSGKYNFRHLLCIESGWRGSILQIVDDLFMAISPYLLSDFADGIVAMPLIGSGDQDHDRAVMLRTILESAVGWLERGLPLKELNIVVYQKSHATSLKHLFLSFRDRYVSPAGQSLRSYSRSQNAHFDVFLSYSHKESGLADYFVQKLKDASGSSCRVFQDKSELREGMAWLMRIANALDRSRRVVALYSENYWASTNCKMEFTAAYTRQMDSDQEILFPIYLSETSIPYMFTALQYADCRVNDRSKIEVACTRLVAMLQTGN